MATHFRACLGVIAAISTFCATGMPARAQNIPGWGYAQRFIGDAQRQQRQEQMRQEQYQRQQYQAQQQAAARERAPHEASAQYSGQLTPVTDLSRLVSGKTLYLERPIVANSQIQSMKSDQTYFAADGRSYSVAWSGRHWLTGGSQVCLDSFQPQSCWRVFQDDARQLYFVPSTNIVMHVARIDSGDTANTRAQFAERQRQEKRNGEFLAGGLAIILGAGGGGGGSSNGDPAHDLHTQQSFDRERANGAGYH